VIKTAPTKSSSALCLFVCLFVTPVRRSPQHPVRLSAVSRFKRGSTRSKTRLGSTQKIHSSPSTDRPTESFTLDEINHPIFRSFDRSRHNETRLSKTNVMVKHIASAEEFAAIKAAGKPVRASARTNERTNASTHRENQSSSVRSERLVATIDRSIGRMTNGFRRVSERATTND